jgi:hypothetical protein
MTEPPTKEQLDEWERMFWGSFAQDPPMGPLMRAIPTLIYEAREVARLRADNDLLLLIQRSYLDAQRTTQDAIKDNESLRAEVARLKEELARCNAAGRLLIAHGELGAEVARLQQVILEAGTMSEPPTKEQLADATLIRHALECLTGRCDCETCQATRRAWALRSIRRESHD